MRRLVLAGLVGLVAGFGSGRTSFGGSVFVLVPWAILGIALGTVAGDRGSTTLVGAIYGFTLSIGFLVAIYQGHDGLVPRLVLLVVLGSFGGGCGAVFGTLGGLAKHRFVAPRIDGTSR